MQPRAGRRHIASSLPARLSFRAACPFVSLSAGSSLTSFAANVHGYKFSLTEIGWRAGALGGGAEPALGRSRSGFGKSGRSREVARSSARPRDSSSGS